MSNVPNKIKKAGQPAFFICTKKTRITFGFCGFIFTDLTCKILYVSSVNYFFTGCVAGCFSFASSSLLHLSRSAPLRAGTFFVQTSFAFCSSVFSAVVSVAVATAFFSVVTAVGVAVASCFTAVFATGAVA